MVSHMNLNHARLPISPHPQNIYFTLLNYYTVFCVPMQAFLLILIINKYVAICKLAGKRIIKCIIYYGGAA